MSDQFYIAIISAVAALTGVALSQVLALLTVQLNRKHARQEVLRQKYERLGNCLDLVVVSLVHHSPKPANAKNHEHIEGHVRELQLLALIYFPLLQPRVKEFYNAALKFNLALIQQSHKSNSEADTEEFNNILTGFSQAREALEQDLQRYAKHYT